MLRLMRRQRRYNGVQLAMGSGTTPIYLVPLQPSGDNPVFTMLVGVAAGDWHYFPQSRRDMVRLIFQTTAAALALIMAAYYDATAAVGLLIFIFMLNRLRQQIAVLTTFNASLTLFGEVYILRLTPITSWQYSQAFTRYFCAVAIMFTVKSLLLFCILWSFNSGPDVVDAVVIFSSVLVIAWGITWVKLMKSRLAHAFIVFCILLLGYNVVAGSDTPNIANMSSSHVLSLICMICIFSTGKILQEVCAREYVEMILPRLERKEQLASY